MDDQESVVDELQNAVLSGYLRKWRDPGGFPQAHEGVDVRSDQALAHGSRARAGPRERLQRGLGAEKKE